MILSIIPRHYTKALHSPFYSRRLFCSVANSSQINKNKSVTGPVEVNFTWPFPDFRRSQKYWEIKSRICIFLVGIAGRTLLHTLNRTYVHNRNILVEAIFKRPPGVPLITVANHESCMDDPALIALSPKQLADQKNMRWGLAAHDICYTKPIHASFFSLGKCIPVVRGNGVYQKSVDFAIERLNTFGDWLHIFPEGRVNTERTNIIRIKWGVGRIISELKTAPIVIPFHHTGMADVLPNRRPYIPRFGNRVFMNVGQPLNIQPVLDSVQDYCARDKRKIITDFIQAEMEKLREVTLDLAQQHRKGVLK